MSGFYKKFLDDAYERQMAYNKEWWKENIGMLIPAFKAAIRNFKKAKPTTIKYFDKSFTN